MWGSESLKFEFYRFKIENDIKIIIDTICIYTHTINNTT